MQVPSLTITSSASHKNALLCVLSVILGQLNLTCQAVNVPKNSVAKGKVKLKINIQITCYTFYQSLSTAHPAAVARFKPVCGGDGRLSVMDPVFGARVV